MVDRKLVLRSIINAIIEILEEYKAAKGGDFSYKEFNERLMSAGSPPFFAIREFMLAED